MKNKKISWNFWAVLILIFCALLQIRHWNAFPQGFDIYYHLLTAWGFIKAGGYTTWDFWQYAPLGRPHIYPPLFHILLALPMKAGIDKILLAKLFNITIPIIFLFTLWNFIRKYFDSRLAFLTLITSGSSFSFYLSLAGHIPSTIAMIFGLFAFGEFFNKRFFRAGLLLSLSFYTHITTSWFFMLALILYVLFSDECKKTAFISLAAAILLSLPILTQQFLHIRSIAPFNFNELHFCEFKTMDYILAALGLALSLNREKKYRLFTALFIASFIYIKYPSRFFSSEGYLPIALLSALSIDSLCGAFAKKGSIKILTIGVILFIFIFSPTVAISSSPKDASFYKVYICDSAFMNMASGAQENRNLSRSRWFNTYNIVSEIIKKNSSPDDIIYCTEGSIGVCLAALSGRATSNYLLPEVYPAVTPDAMADAKIIVMLKYHSPEWVKERIERYGLKLIEKTSILDIYINPSAKSHIQIKKALVPFIFNL